MEIWQLQAIVEPIVGRIKQNEGCAGGTPFSLSPHRTSPGGDGRYSVCLFLFRGIVSEGRLIRYLMPHHHPYYCFEISSPPVGSRPEQEPLIPPTPQESQFHAEQDHDNPFGGS